MYSYNNNIGSQEVCQSSLTAQKWQVWLMREFLKLLCNPSLTNIINKNNTVSGREMKEANDILCCNFCFRPIILFKPRHDVSQTPVLSYFLSHFSLSPWTALPQHLTLNDPTYESNYLFRLYFQRAGSQKIINQIIF